jgi:hypothetical protein
MDLREEVKKMEEATSKKRKRVGVSGPATVEEVLGSEKSGLGGGVGGY